MITEKISTLKIHKFKTKEQYHTALENGQVNATDLCLTPEDEVVDLTSAQTITGTKTFPNGIIIGNAQLTYDSINERLIISFK